MIECVDLSRHPFLAQCFSECVVDPAQPSERHFIAEQVHDAGLLLERCGYDHQQVSTRSQSRQTRLEVATDSIELRLRQKTVLERCFAETAEQRTPMIVGAEGMIGDRIFPILPAVSQFLLESRHCLVGPRPVAE